MDSSSTSSSRGPGAPRALLLAILLIAAGEAAAALSLPANQGRHPTDEVLARIEDDAIPRPVVIWSDSVTAGSIPKVGEPGDDPGIANIGSSQSIGLPGVYFTYRRWVERHGPPGLLVVNMVPEGYGNDLRGEFTGTYFETVFLRPAEVRDAALSTRRIGLTARMCMNALLLPPSMRSRREVKGRLQELLGRGSPSVKPAPRRRILGVDPEVAASLSERARLREFAVSDLSREYMERIFADAGREGTRVVLMTPAVPGEVMRGWEETGYIREYAARLEAWGRSGAHVSVEPVDRFADYAVADMYDRVHLKPDASRRYGERVLARLRELGRDSR